MAFSKHILTTANSTLHTAPARRRKLRTLASLFVLCAAACDDMEDPAAESEQDLAPAVEQDERELAANEQDAEEPAPPGEVGDAEPPAMDGLDTLQAAPRDPSAVHSLCCFLDFSDPFQVFVRIPNPGPTILTECSDLFAGQNQINFKVYHTYGSPAPFTGTTGSIPLGTTRVISLSHPGYMNALSCEAWR